MKEYIIIKTLQEFRKKTQESKLKSIFRGEIDNQTKLTTSLGRFFNKIDYEKNDDYKEKLNNIK